MNRPHYSLVTPPLAEPVSYAQAAEHLRVDSVEDQIYIEGLIGVAREYVDSITGRVSMSSTWLSVAPSWHAMITGDQSKTIYPIHLPYSIPLHRTPLVSVSSVKYYAPDASTLTTMSTDDYRVITSIQPGILQLTGTIPSVDDRPDAIQVQFVAGYSTPDLVPPGLRHAVKMLVANLYEERKPIAFASCSEIPFALRSLIENQRLGGWFA